MTVEAHELESRLLQLPAEERARLLERLIESFRAPAGTQPEWMELARRRRDEVQSGKVTMVPGDEALARVRARVS